MIQVAKDATAKSTLIFVLTVYSSNFFHFCYLYEYFFLTFLWPVSHSVFNAHTVTDCLRQISRRMPGHKYLSDLGHNSTGSSVAHCRETGQGAFGETVQPFLVVRVES